MGSVKGQVSILDGVSDFAGDGCTSEETVNLRRGNFDYSRKRCVHFFEHSKDFRLQLVYRDELATKFRGDDETIGKNCAS